ncbi:hypothetical protein ACFGVS_01095 [Mucilaginibacter sp. AW1-7]|uniref:hypothetical protein n=1 Tax=Mucilaginibacter sp. AW1-7 TaxID=3349874 RepID=UPI003F7346A3
MSRRKPVEQSRQVYQFIGLVVYYWRGDADQENEQCENATAVVIEQFGYKHPEVEVKHPHHGGI